MVHELRIYHCAPGKLPQVLQRFEKSALPLWSVHGIRPIGFWTTLIGPSNHDVYYILEWENLAERERRWTAFMNDPQWLAARAESEREGALLTSISNVMLAPTAFAARFPHTASAARSS